MKIYTTFSFLHCIFLEVSRVHRNFGTVLVLLPKEVNLTVSVNSGDVKSYSWQFHSQILSSWSQSLIMCTISFKHSLINIESVWVFPCLRSMSLISSKSIRQLGYTSWQKRSPRFPIWNPFRDNYLIYFSNFLISPNQMPFHVWYFPKYRR